MVWQKERVQTQNSLETPLKVRLKQVLGFSVLRLRLHFGAPVRPEDSFTGATWRGAFGYALKKHFCALDPPFCKTCELPDACPYSFLFETKAPGGTLLEQGAEAPHAFLLTLLPRSEDRACSLQLTLFGPAISFASEILSALRAAASNGIGPKRTRFSLQSIQRELPETKQWVQVSDEPDWRQDAGPEIPEPPRQCFRVQLVTPLRLKQGQRLLTPKTLSGSDFVSHLIRRMSLLWVCYGSPSAIDYEKLFKAASAIRTVDSSLIWKDFGRFSSRQNQHLRFGGVMGFLDIDLCESQQLWPYIWAGQFVHAGKLTSFGFGMYELFAAV